jgi:hypothetical protein
MRRPAFFRERLQIKDAPADSICPHSKSLPPPAQGACTNPRNHHEHRTTQGSTNQSSATRSRASRAREVAGEIHGHARKSLDYAAGTFRCHCGTWHSILMEDQIFFTYRKDPLDSNYQPLHDLYLLGLLQDHVLVLCQHLGLAKQLVKQRVRDEGRVLVVADVASPWTCCRNPNSGKFRSTSIAYAVTSQSAGKKSPAVSKCPVPFARNSPFGAFAQEGRTRTGR